MKQFSMLAVGIAAVAITAACLRGGTDQRQPGEWESVVTLKSVEIPGAPPQMAAMMSGRIGQSQTGRECLTPETARDPLGEMRRMLTQGNGQACTFTDQVFAGGTIRIHGTCPGPNGQGSAGVALDGTYTETTMQATMTVNAQGAGVVPIPGATGMRMSTEVRGRRVGDCTSPAPATPAAPTTTGNAL